MKMEKWGLVEAWLSMGPGRMLVMTCGAKGLQIHLIDPSVGERIETVQQDEDPSTVALRAVGQF